MKFKLIFFVFLCFSLNAQSDKVWMHPNRGQWHENINYKIDLSGGEMLIEQNTFTYVFHNAGDLMHNHTKQKERKQIHEDHKTFKQHIIKTNFIGSNPNHGVTENKTSSFYRNYFLGNDPSKWKSNIHAISKLSYDQFYDGIDLFLESKESSLKYSFIIAPQIDVSQIKYKIDGANKVKIDKNGSLIIEHIFGKISESKPIAWTLDEKGNKTSVVISYKLIDNVVSYDFPNDYNHNQKLVIDPELTFSSYTGSSADNWGCTATPDSQGNLFAGGTVYGAGYPITSGVLDGSFNGGLFDIGLSKFSANGSNFLYSTYIGGGENECPNSMIANANGELYIMGVTSSNDFPMVNGGFDNTHNGGVPANIEYNSYYNKTDIYVIRISANGSILMNSTFVGGSGNDGINEGTTFDDIDLVYNYGDNFRGEIALDNSGNVIVASSTNSTNFPTINASQTSIHGIQDAVLFKLNPTLSSMLWSTYYGGGGIECGNALTVNSLNEIYLTGGTMSTDLAVPSGHSTIYTGGEVDGYLARFNANGSLLSGTYIGTNEYDQSFFVQVDLDNFVYVYGQSYGSMPISAGLFGNTNAQQFIRKYNQNLSAVVWNTKIGGSNQRISPTAFLVSNCYEIYIAGWGGNILNSYISGFPITTDAFQSATDGDAFYIAVYDPNMAALQYATFMGGSSSDHVDGGTSRFDKNGRIYHAVCSACGGDPNGFVSTPGVASPTNNSNNCNLAAFKFELNSINAIITEPDYIICIPNPVQFFNNSTEGDVYFWDFGDNTTSNEANPSHVYNAPGDYTVKLVVSDSQGCKDPDSTSFVISVGSFEAGHVTPPPIICKGSPYQFDAFGGLHYTWSPANVLDDPTIPNPTATIFQTTDFSVIISDTCGTDTVFVTLNVFDDEISVSNDVSICLGQSTQIEVFGSVSQTWSPNSFMNDNTLSNPIVNPNVSTNYIVTATTLNNCIFKDSVFVDVFFDLPIPVMDDSVNICEGSWINVNVNGGQTYLWSPNQYINTTIGNQVTVSPPIDFTYYCDFTNACGTVRDSIFIDVIIPNVNAYQDTIICFGESAYLSAVGATTYQWTPASSLNSASIANVIASPQTMTNYRVIGTDNFGCIDTAFVLVELFPIHPVDAGSVIFAHIGENIQLNAISNTIGEFSWLPKSYLSCITCPDPIANPNHNFDYTVYFKDTNGCITSDLVHIYYKGIIYVPNSFTPDGNGFNEVFKAYGEGIKDFEMSIFNRWGELICTLDSIDDFWDGKYKGEMCEDGTYTWKLTFNDITNVYQTIMGHVNLLK